MLRNKLLLVLLAIVVVAPIALSGCSKGEALAKELNISLGTEPPTLDVALQTDTTSGAITEMLFLGLTDLDDETVETLPELATKWTVSDDGLVWTFEMRKDVDWVHYDPATKKATKQRKVTANDVEYAVKRMLDPETASDYAYVAYIIKGAEAFNTGESTDRDSIGVRAVDEYTVEFTLEQPAGYFPTIAGMWVNRPVPQERIDEFGEQWTEPGNIWTNGPYMLETWEHESKVVLVKSPYWWDAKEVSIETINLPIVPETSTAFAMFENGELDVAAVPVEEMERIQADPEMSQLLFTSPVLCTYYFGFNTTLPPFDNTKVRQAFSYAIDRQKVIDVALGGAQKPAQTFAPPGIFGSPAENPEFPGIKFDAAKAKDLLAEAGFPNGEGLPEVTLMFNTSEGHQKIAEAVQQQIKENLGVEIKLANQEWNVYLQTVHDNAPQMYRMAWCLDYPDENNWMSDVFHPIKGANEPKWDPNSPGAQKFIDLIERAAASPDPDEREKLYFEAEKVFCADEAIIVPIYYYASQGVTKSYVERTYSKQGGEGSHWNLWKVKAH